MSEHVLDLSRDFNITAAFIRLTMTFNFFEMLFEFSLNLFSIQYCCLCCFFYELNLRFENFYYLVS